MNIIKIWGDLHSTTSNHETMSFVGYCQSYNIMHKVQIRTILGFTCANLNVLSYTQTLKVVHTYIVRTSYRNTYKSTRIYVGLILGVILYTQFSAYFRR